MEYKYISDLNVVNLPFNTCQNNIVVSYNNQNL